MREGDSAASITIASLSWRQWPEADRPQKFLLILEGKTAGTDAYPDMSYYSWSQEGSVSSDASLSGGKPLPEEARQKFYLDAGKAYEYVVIEFPTGYLQPWNGLPNPNRAEVGLNLTDDSTPEVVESLELSVWAQVPSAVTCYDWYPKVDGVCWGTGGARTDVDNFYIFDNDGTCDAFASCVYDDMRDDGYAQLQQCRPLADACKTEARVSWQGRQP